MVAFSEEINISQVKREEKRKLNAPAKRWWYELGTRCLGRGGGSCQSSHGGWRGRKHLVQWRLEIHASVRPGTPFSKRPPASNLAYLIFEVFHLPSPKSSEGFGKPASEDTCLFLHGHRLAS